MSASSDAWRFTFCAGYLVPPCKGRAPDQAMRMIRGSPINVDRLPPEFFTPLFCEAHQRCPIGIVFVREDGEPTNAVRDLVRSIAQGDRNAKTTAAKELACRLACASRRISRLGLFVVLAGSGLEGTDRVLLWKFPADETLQARMSANEMNISLLEDAFSRSSSYFKAAMFEGGQAESHFWRGRVDDRQAKQRVRKVADFWILDFLNALPELTDARGTGLVAKALRSELSKADSVESMEALMGAALLLRSLAGQTVSIREFAMRFVPEALHERFVRTAGGPGIADFIFAVDAETVDKELKFKTIVVDETFFVRGPTNLFDDKVAVRPTEEPAVVEVSLRGAITGQKLAQR